MIVHKTSKKLNKPPLKWAGNKLKLAHVIDGIVARYGWKRGLFVEPFCGTCSVSMNLDGFNSFWLLDLNLDLIDFHRFVQTSFDEISYYIDVLFVPENNNRHQYNHLRSLFNDFPSSCPYKSALFLYLNRHGYNGLCRYNKSGKFNVPFGRYTRPYKPTDELAGFHSFSQRAEFYVKDFGWIWDELKPGDIVYCDPPYWPRSKTANFVGYIGEFSKEQQVLLAGEAEVAASKGIKVIISNNDLPETQELYSRAKEIVQVSMPRSISRNANERHSVSEILAIYY